MRDRFQSLLAAILALTSIVIAVVLVHREFYAAQAVRPFAVEFGPPKYIPTWENVLASGVFVGDTNSKVTIVEFSDLECPVCRGFDRTMRDVKNKYPRDVALVFVYFPLTQHRFARPAARAAECANSAGRFREFVSVVYDKQDSLGLKPWASYAREAGIGDTSAFLNCVAETATVARIDSGIALGRKIGVHGTPTGLVNGGMFSSPPADTELIRSVGMLLAGKRPFDNVQASAVR
jgi:protein-disulfide isomerase